MDYVFTCCGPHVGSRRHSDHPPGAHHAQRPDQYADARGRPPRQGRARFCFISSGAAYPPTADRPVREAEMFDGDPHEVYFAAGWMKRYAEILCRTYAEKIAQPMPTVVVRPSNVYGPYDKFDFAVSHVTAALIRRVVERQSPARGLGHRRGHSRPDLCRRLHRRPACRLRDRPALSCGQYLRRHRPLRPADPGEAPGVDGYRQCRCPLRSLAPQHHPGAADGQRARARTPRLRGTHPARRGAAPHHRSGTGRRPRPPDQNGPRNRL